MAVPVFYGKQQFLDRVGVALALGTVAHYIPGTLTPKQTWADAGQTVLNSNPITLDAGGYAMIYGSGAYRQIVKDALGNTIWDQVAEAVDVEADLAAPDGSGGNLMKLSHSTSYLAATAGQRFAQDIYVTDDPYNATYGSTDNYSAIMAAITKVAATGGNVILPAAPSPYKVSQKLDPPSGVILQGQGKSQASYGSIAVPATIIQPTGTDPAVLLGNGTSFNGVKNIGFFCTGSSSAAVQVGSGNTQQINYNGDSILEDIIATGFSAAGAKALDYQAALRGRAVRIYTINNYSNIGLGALAQLSIFSGNVSVNNAAGYAIDATSGGTGGVDFMAYDVYFESCPGQYPINCLNPGVYRFIGRGVEAMCTNGATTVTNPAIWNAGGNVILDIDINTIDYFSTGDNLAGILSLVNMAEASQVRFRARNVSMNYQGSGRVGATYQAFTGSGLDQYTDIDIALATGTGFASIQAARQAYSPLINATYTPWPTRARAYVKNGGNLYFENLNPHTISTPNAGNSGSVSGIAYRLVQTGAGSSSYTIDTLPILTMGSSHEIALEIAGFTTAGGAPGNMSASLSVVCGGTTTVPISAVTNTSRAFKARVKLKCIARQQYELEVEYTDGSTTSFARQAIAMDNVVNTIALNVTATNVNAGDATTISTITMDRH